MKKTIGKIIREKRIDKGLSQIDLGACMGVGFQTISDYENGRRMPSIEWVFKCCECLEIDPAEFVSELKEKM